MENGLTYENIDPKVRSMAMIGLALGMLVACMDGTIVGTCGKTIASDLGGMELYQWMITAYLLCESAMVPIAGKMSDRYGRKPLFMIGLVLFGLGSICAGLSTSMMMLIICRAVQGIGGGILMPVAMAAVADFYSPEDRGKIQGMLGAVFGIGSGIGPLVGGAVCEYASWHWAFYINIPIIIVCILLTLKKFPEQSKTSDKKIDYFGISVLTILIFDILLYFQWISDDMKFTDLKSILMILLAVAMVALFVYIEKRAEDPVIAPKLIHNKTVVRAAIYMFIMGLAMIGTLTYIAIYLQMVYDMKTMECGLCMLPLVFGMMITSMGSGMMVNKTGYRIWVIAGSVMIIAALLLMSTMTMDTDRVILFIYMFVFGLGLGCVNSTVMISVQNHSKSSEMGMTTSAVSLFRNVGSTVGTASYALIMTAVMNGKFAESAFGYLAGNFSGLGLFGILDVDYLIAHGIIPGPIVGEIAKTIIASFTSGVTSAFLFAGILYIVALILGLRMDKGYTTSEEDE